jgi:hypothetical protein
MRTQIQIITYSKLITIIKCCIAALLIALAVSTEGKIDLQEFIQNILEWESI